MPRPGGGGSPCYGNQEKLSMHFDIQKLESWKCILSLTTKRMPLLGFHEPWMQPSGSRKWLGRNSLTPHTPKSMTDPGPLTWTHTSCKRASLCRHTLESKAKVNTHSLPSSSWETLQPGKARGQWPPPHIACRGNDPTISSPPYDTLTPSSLLRSAKLNF